MNICIEALIRAFFILIKLAVKNWFWTLLVILLGFIARKSPYVFAFFALIADLIQDSVLGLSIFTGGLLAVIGKFAMGTALVSFIAAIWAIMLFFSPANIVLKLLAWPAIIILGAVAAILPFISLPMHLLLAFAFKDRTMANITCVAAIVFTVLLSMVSMGGFCGLLNKILMLI